MSTPEALMLADELWRGQVTTASVLKSAAELRRQHAEIERLTAEASTFHMAYRIKCDTETKAQAVEIERLTAAHHAAVELSNTMHGRWIAAEAERDALRKALTRVKAEAVSLADAQVIALEALKGDKP
jgi:hypothetical protein